MSVLILGGTNDALRLAEGLHQRLRPTGVEIIYSLAGLVRVPKTDYRVITGGFSQYGGLDNYIKQHDIIGIVDATHPYANNISDVAYAAALNHRIPYWQFDRPKWQQQSKDKWFEYQGWDELLPMLQDKQSIFITTGQLTPQTLQSLSQKLSAKVLLRTAIKPAVSKPAVSKPTAASTTLGENIHWIQAIGPFTLEDEISLMREHAVDALVSKNSGGDATMAKLHAARQLQVPVYLLKRPLYQRLQDDGQDSLLDCLQNNQKSNQTVFSQLSDCEEAVVQYFNCAPFQSVST